MSYEHPIHEAAFNGDIDAIKHHLSLGVSINLLGDYSGRKKAVLKLIILLFNKERKINKKREERKMMFLFLYLSYYSLLIDEWRLLSFMLH